MGMTDATQDLMDVHDDRVGVTEFTWGGLRTADEKSIYDGLADLVPDEPGLHVTDLACGSGALLRMLAAREASPSLVGIDLNAKEVARAATRLPSDISLIEAPAEAMTLADASQDFVLSSMSVFFFDPLDDAIAEICRVIRPGGSLGAIVANVHTNDTYENLCNVLLAEVEGEHPDKKRYGWGNPQTWTREGWQQVFSNKGWANLMIEPWDLRFPIGDANEDAKKLSRFFYGVMILSPQARDRVVTAWAKILSDKKEVWLPLERLVARKAD